MPSDVLQYVVTFPSSRSTPSFSPHPPPYWRNASLRNDSLRNDSLPNGENEIRRSTDYNAPRQTSHYKITLLLHLTFLFTSNVVVLKLKVALIVAVVSLSSAAERDNGMTRALRRPCGRVFSFLILACIFRKECKRGDTERREEATQKP